MKRAPLAAAVLAAAGLAALGAFFLSRYERATQRRWTGYTGEARANPYHALRRLLEAYGVEVRAFDAVEQLAVLPPGDATLLLPTQRDTLPAGLSARLRGWVESGGHLVVVIWTLHGQARPRDPLLDPLDLRQTYAPDAGRSRDDASGGDAAIEPPPAEVRLDGRALSVRFDPRYALEDAGVPAAGRFSDAFGTHAVWYALGCGRLSVFTDVEFLTNDALRDHDHGEFALRLLARGEPAGPVWIAYAERHAPLWQLLARHAWPAGLALALLLSLAFWRAAPRFGPVLPGTPRARRRLAEHLDAAGRHGWRWDRGASLLASVRAALRRDLARRRPELALDERRATAALRALALQLGLDAQQVERALGAEQVSDPEDFAERVRSLELLRRGL